LETQIQIFKINQLSILCPSIDSPDDPNLKDIKRLLRCIYDLF